MEDSESKTAFATPDGTFQWNTMPQGLTNAPATFLFNRKQEKEGKNRKKREVHLGSKFVDNQSGWIISNGNQCQFQKSSPQRVSICKESSRNFSTVTVGHARQVDYGKFPLLLDEQGDVWIADTSCCTINFTLVLATVSFIQISVGRKRALLLDGEHEAWDLGMYLQVASSLIQFIESFNTQHLVRGGLL
jgi:hypothetical protein